MNSENFIQMNKISHLHNGKTHIFCKTDFLIPDLEWINSFDEEVTLITGNSDYCITDEIAAKAPPNIKKWFCQNKMSSNPVLKSMPIGVENTVRCGRYGHGVILPHSIRVVNELASVEQREPTKLIYSNFSIQTNPSLRSEVMLVCKGQKHIDWCGKSLSHSEYLLRCLDYRMVVCPEGNGPDTIRFWETLYLNRVPIARLSKATEDFKDLPVVWLKDWGELRDKSLILSRYEECKDKSRELCNVNYWKNLITSK